MMHWSEGAFAASLGVPPFTVATTTSHQGMTVMMLLLLLATSSTVAWTLLLLQHFYRRSQTEKDEAYESCCSSSSSDRNSGSRGSSNSSNGSTSRCRSDGHAASIPWYKKTGRWWSMERRSNPLSTGPGHQMEGGQMTGHGRFKSVPRHIAVIMDGNRRFGRAKFSDPLQGHWEGGKTLSDFTRWCMDRHVEMLTVYAFSTENWRRDAKEVSTLMTIFCKYAESMKKEAMERGVRVKVLSTDPGRLPSHVREAIQDLEGSTKDCTRFHLNLCISYGARGEIANACRSVVAQVAEGKLAIEAIDEEVLGQHLLTASMPDPDLLIRTSGENRLSNFLLYQLAYSEMVFLDKYWPEVTEGDLDKVFELYALRDRRYGS